ncbi:MAG: hypothetical protein O3A25_04965 [Acidobacteria bacterium]|nr:hypothetical protein [Acidobacteriota bacterium]
MMDRRLRARAVPVAALVASLTVATSAAGQTTPWGDPDLQGTWTTSGATPMERPDALAGREKLSDEEVQSIRAQTEARDLELLNAPAERTEVGTNPGAYNNFWMDPGARTDRTSMLIDPPTGRFPAQTATGVEHTNTQQKAPGGMEKNDTWEDRHIWERCVTRGGMPNAMFPRGYNNNMQLFQAPGVVVMLIEQVHEVRVVPLDDRPQVSDKVTQWNGLSRGHWEGDTLVVETANLDGRVSALQPWSDFSSHKGSGKGLTLVERFTRVSPDTLEYEVEVNDPTMYTAPWTVNYPFTQMSDLLYEYACHEGNVGMEGILTGGRAEDLAAGR